MNRLEPGTLYDQFPILQNHIETQEKHAFGEIKGKGLRYHGCEWHHPDQQSEQIALSGAAAVSRTYHTQPPVEEAQACIRHTLACGAKQKKNLHTYCIFFASEPTS